ncbi:MAG: MaoC family dehydratase N-terminal domain-containing protein [Chloroflexi bacterium]|nr:MaoC family dehydratase N-terminal domain-containing protein [Chloroflexota bacterium]
MDMEEAVARARENIGREWGPHTLTIDIHWLRHVVEATEDPNPLWTDERFARNTSWGGIIMPPWAVCSLQGRFRIRLRPVLDLGWGTGSVNAGVQYQIVGPIRPGDEITCRYRLIDVFSKQGRTAPLVFIRFEQQMINQRGETVLIGRQASAHYEGAGLSEARPIAEPTRPPRKANAAEGLWLEEVAPSLRRDPGPGPLFEEVDVGDALSPVSRGPIQVRSQVKWLTSTEDLEEMHYDYVYCRQIGLPDVISNGNFGYCSTGGRMLTDWLGTEGVLTAFSTNYRAPTYINDTLTAKGVVTAKNHDDKTVDIDVTVENQRGEKAVMGTATARLRSQPA